MIQLKDSFNVVKYYRHLPWAKTGWVGAYDGSLILTFFKQNTICKSLKTPLSLYFLLHTHIFELTLPTPFYRLRPQQKKGKINTFSQHSWLNNGWINNRNIKFLMTLSLLQIKQDTPRSSVPSKQCLTVSIAQGISSKTCFLRCSFRQILGVNLRLLCKAVGP